MKTDTHSLSLQFVEEDRDGIGLTVSLFSWGTTFPIIRYITSSLDFEVTWRWHLDLRFIRRGIPSFVVIM